MVTRVGLRLASFDGGGARSFSQLEIMRAIMHQLKWDEHPNEQDRVMLPCDYFDLIGGSDTGGLISIMFSKLRMSVEEASEEFFTICERVYQDQSLAPSERTQRLRACMEDILSRKKLPLDLKLLEKPEEGRSACFVLAMLRANAGNRTCLRSYPTRGQPASPITVVDAVLATCATQPAFSPVVSGTGYRKQEYLGAGHGANNPIREVITEAHSLFGGDSTVASLLSLGSGNPGAISFPVDSSHMDMHRVTLDMMKDCEQKAQEMQQQLGRVGIYFRLSVNQGMQNAHQEQFSDIGWMVAQTEGYLAQSETCDNLSAYAKSKEERAGIITLDRLKYTGGSEAVYKGTPMLATHYVKRHGPRNVIIQGIESERYGQRVIVVTGMPGCGKTQLITDLAQEFSPERSSNFDFVFFVNGASEASIKVDLIAHARHVMPPGSQVNFSSAMSFFQNPQNSKWLIAFDNVDDVNIELPNFFPQCNHGTILVTSRNQSLGMLVSQPHLHLKLDVMSTDESIEVLVKCARKQAPSTQESKVLSKIAETLGCLPIALSQAGCYMAETGCSGDEYIELLSESRVQLLDRPTRTRQRDCAYATFDISYKNLPANIQNLVHLLSFFQFANFPMRMISHAAKNSFRFEPFPFVARGPEFERSVQTLNETFLVNGQWTNLCLQEVVLILQSYSMASFTTTPFTKLLRIHPLMRDWAFDRLTHERRILFHGAALRLLLASVDETPLQQYLFLHAETVVSRFSDGERCINDLAALGKLLRLQNKLKAAQAIWLPIYDALRETHGPDHLHIATAALELAATFDESTLEQMERLESEAVRIRTTLLGPRHIDTLKASGELSGTLTRQGRKGEAVELRQQVLDQLKQQLPAHDPIVLESAGALARIHAHQNAFSEAEKLQKQVVEETRAQLGEDHLDTLKAMSELAWTYYSQSHYPEAEELQVKVLERRKEQLGDAHVDTLNAVHNLASTYYHQSRYHEAEELQVKVLERKQEQLGDAHADTLNVMHNLAWIYYSQGRYHEAEELQVKVLERKQEQLGDAHSDTLSAMHSLAWTYYSQSRYPKAEDLQVKVLERRKELLGYAHVDTLQIMHNLASTYYSQSRYPEAEELQVTLLEQRKEQLGDAHVDTLNVMHNLASTYYAQSRYPEAEELQVKVLERRKEQLGDAHADTLNAVHNLASTYHHQGRYPEAEQLQVKVLKQRKEQLGDAHTDTLKIMSELAWAYYSQSRYPEAEEIQVKVLERRKEQLGDAHADTLDAMHKLASTYYSQGRYPEAEELQVEVLQQIKQQLGDVHANTLNAMHNLALTYYRQSRYPEAEELDLNVLEKIKAQLGDTHPAALKAMADLAWTYYPQSRYPEAEDLQVKVLEQIKAQLGDTHIDTLVAMSNLASNYYSQGRFPEAEELQVKVLKERKMQQGDDHPDTLNVTKTLSQIYRKQGRISEANALAPKSVDNACHHKDSYEF